MGNRVENLILRLLAAASMFFLVLAFMALYKLKFSSKTDKSLWRKAYQRADFFEAHSSHNERSIFSNINEGRSEFLFLVHV